MTLHTNYRNNVETQKCPICGKDRARDWFGFVCPPSPEGVADAIERIADPETLARFRANMERERERFSWEEMCRRLLEVYALTAKRAV